MIKIFCTISFLFIGCFTNNILAQQVNIQKSNTTPINVESEFIDGTVKVIKDSSVIEFDEATFLKINNINFTNGEIEVKVLSRLLPQVPDFARGFIGVAFRINEDNSNFECIYLRPTNSRSNDQVRRNHSIQYFSYPDFKFQRLRKESPEKYESYSDFSLDEWITIKLKIKDSEALLFLNGAEYPSLIVNHLKLGENASGGIGFFVDIGTEGYFKDLVIQNYE